MCIFGLFIAIALIKWGRGKGLGTVVWQSIALHLVLHMSLPGPMEVAVAVAVRVRVRVVTLSVS